MVSLLIEVMITVAVVAILAAVALPQYRDYVTAASRGHLAPATLQVQAEQYLQDNRTTSAPPCATDSATSKVLHLLLLRIVATAYTLRAVGRMPPWPASPTR